MFRQPVLLTLGLTFTLTLMHSVTAHAGENGPKVSVVVGHFLPGEVEGAGKKPAFLKEPFGIDFDADGRMFIVELAGGRVHELTPDGKLSTIAGDGSKGYTGDGGPAAKATFDGMHNVAVSAAGDIYIADSWNHCVRKIDGKSREITTFAGTGKAGFGGDGGPARKADFDFLMCITLSPTGDKMYIADLKNRRIRVIDMKTMTVDTVAGNGKAGVPADGAAAEDSPLVDPRAVASDREGNVYILERGGHALRVVRPDGKIYTVAGNGKQGFRDGPGREAQLAGPKHLCVDGEGNVYIADDLNKAVRKYDPRTKSLTTVLGRGVGTPAVQLNHPHGVCIEGGRLYVIDSGNNRILKVEN